LNPNICDDCNYYFGNRDINNSQYSIEEALKETFNIPRKRLLTGSTPRRKIGDFKSKFFEVKIRNGKYRLSIKQSFKFSPNFQKELCRSFKRGLYKMYFEELNRQKKIRYEKKFNPIRDFARYNKNNLPVIHYHRKHGAIRSIKREAESPVLIFDRMLYLISNDKFVEIEFLGLVFGFPICDVSVDDFRDYTTKTMIEKKDFFTGFSIIEKLTDIDFTLSILND